MKEALKEKFAKVAIAELDQDKDGKVTKADLMAYMSHSSFDDEIRDEFERHLPSGFIEPTSPGLVGLGIFIYADKDRDLKISLAEATAFLSEMNTVCNLQLPSNEAATRFETIDEKHIGYLDFTAFTQFYGFKEMFPE